MEQNTAQQPYCDSPAPSRSPSPTHESSPSSQRTASTVKPLPAVPIEPPTYQDEEPYRDDPSTATADSHSPRPAQHLTIPTYQRYTDAESNPPTPSDENIPLAHFLLNPYPHDSPPSYSVAIQQSHHLRTTSTTHENTPGQYIPPYTSTSHHPSHPSHQYNLYHNQRLSDRTSAQYAQFLRGPVVLGDEESGLDTEQADDARHSMEKIVAMFVVAALLLVLSGMLAWLALGSGVV